MLADSRSVALADSGGGQAVAVAAGYHHSIVLKQDGSVWAAGDDSSGQLGDGSFKAEPTRGFVKVISGGAVAAAACWYHSLVLKNDGSVWATGSNEFGQLGVGTKSNQMSYVKVVSSGATAVAAGAEHSAIVKQDGSLWTTGIDIAGQLGDGGSQHDFGEEEPWSDETYFYSYSYLWTKSRDSFAEIIPGGVEAIAAGGYHTLVLKQNGSVWGAGRNIVGQLGIGHRNDWLTFVEMIASGGKAVTAGGEHSLVVKQDGSVWATGRNDFGQLGDGTTIGRIKFVQVISSGVKTVAAGLVHSLALKEDGSVWTTGDNEYGQLGDGTTIARSSFAQVVSRGVKAVAAGGHHNLILKQDGSVWVTGDNKDGQLGDGSTTYRSSFVQINGTCGAKFRLYEQTEYLPIFAL